MEEGSANPTPEPKPEPTPQPAPQPQMVGATPTPVTPTPVTPAVEPVAVSPKPEQINTQAGADKKILLKKKIARGVAAGYVGILVLIFGWAFTLAGRFTFPNHFLFALFTWMMLLLCAGSALWLLSRVLQKVRVKKDMMIAGGALFLSLALWIGGIFLLNPRLNPELRYESVIQTLPEETLGLTAPVEIKFSASAVPINPKDYDILAYSWNFGDGDTANGEEVSHRYLRKGSQDGLYTVVLTVEVRDAKTGEKSSFTYSKEVSIENEQTSAAFTATPDKGEAPLEVTFDASASFDPDGEISLYEWDFNEDGRYDDAEGERVEHTFTQDGIYEISLRVTDNNGDFNVTSQTIEVGNIGALNAVITPDLEASNGKYYQGESIRFSANDSSVREGKITKYTWDFGDGTVNQGANVSHLFSKTGKYTISLTIEDNQGNTDQTELAIEVVAMGTAPVAKISSVPEAKAGLISGSLPLQVVFSADQSLDAEDDIIEYQWDFDGDSVIDARGKTTSYSYKEEGRYEMTLIVIDSTGNEAKSSLFVEVLPEGLTAVLDVDLTNGEVPLPVIFDASGSRSGESKIVSYEYDFGDGKTWIGGSTVKYKYSTVGTFTATVTVVADDGSRASDSVQIVVRPVGLNACFTVPSARGNAPLVVSVDPSCSTGTVNGYKWDFGDGDISFDRKPEPHIYTEAGSYTITLEISNDVGIVDTFQLVVTAE